MTMTICSKSATTGSSVEIGEAVGASVGGIDGGAVTVGEFLHDGMKTKNIITAAKGRIFIGITA